jgi:cytoskeletal protein CcmA (bactofilin family)
VEIHPGGTVRGEVVAPEFQIERGAIFQGTSAMPEIVEDEAEADSEE